MLVASLSYERHVVLFNKFALVPNHLLIITKEFEAQEELLRLEHFTSAVEALKIFKADSVNWLVFYNSGELSGASQPHRHLQMIPFTGDHQIPLEAVISSSKSMIPAFNGIRHFFTGHKLTPEELLLHYQKAMNEFQTSSYNLLLTEDWLLFVPRRSEHSFGHSFNSLAFAGCFLMKSEEEFDAWSASVDKSPIRSLLDLAIPADF